MRVTLGMLTSRIKTNLSDSAERLLEAQNRTSSGKRITKPSDDVPGVGRALGLRSVISNMEQLNKNCDVAENYLSITSSMLTTCINAVNTAKTLGLQAANGTQSAEARQTIATQLDGICEQLAGVGNTQHLGGYLFSGGLSDKPAIVPNPGGATPPYVYQGNSTQFTVQVNPGSYIPTTITGDMVFNMNSQAVPGTPDLFTTIKTLRDKIVAGDTGDISDYLKQVDANQNNLIGIRSQVGARLSRLESGRETLLTTTNGFKDMLSKTEDADFAESAIDLQTQQNVYQAAITTASKVMQVSLADFLK